MFPFQGHIGSTSWGIALLNPASKTLCPPAGIYIEDDDDVIEDDFIDVIKEIVDLAQDCGVLTVRGWVPFALPRFCKFS